MLCYLNCFIQLVSFTVLLLRSVFLVVHMCSFLKKGLKLYFYIVIYILWHGLFWSLQVFSYQPIHHVLVGNFHLLLLSILSGARPNLNFHGADKISYSSIFKMPSRSGRKPNLTHSFPVHPFSTPWKRVKGELGTNGLNKTVRNHSEHPLNVLCMFKVRHASRDWDPGWWIWIGTCLVVSSFRTFICSKV